MVNGQDFRLDVTTLSNQNSWWPLFLRWEWHYSCAHLTNGDNTELWLPYSSTNKPEWSPPSEFIPQQKSPLYYNTRMHTIVCTTETIIHFRWTVFLHPPKYSSILKKSKYSCLVRISLSLSSAATGTLHSAVSHHWYNGIFTALFSKVCSPSSLLLNGYWVLTCG